MFLRALSRTPHPLPRLTRPFQFNAVRVHVSVPEQHPPGCHRRAGPRKMFHSLMQGTTAVSLNSDSRPSVLARVRYFHATSRREAAPIVGILGILKASTILEIVRAAGRITLTFVPMILIKNFVSRKFLRKVDAYTASNPDTPHPFFADQSKMDAKRTTMIQGIRKRTYLVHALMFSPILLFGLAILASLEQTPLTGRWRAILLSPEEEEAIAQQLAGPGWYRAVGEILAKEGNVTLIPPSDWRYIWVNKTLRHLETVIPSLGDESKLAPDWYTHGDDSEVPLPPPADYPLRPRARASERLRLFCRTVNGEPVTPGAASHHIPGPPYSLIVVDDPKACNAFSYGFGPDGAGGIVVFSGFIDRILRENPGLVPPETPQQATWWSYILGGPINTRPPHPEPTPEQTADLAVLLSHELSHLILAHHLETLSQGTVLMPGVLSIMSDVLRTVLFPVTALFGPFVNDALASLGAAGSLELSRCGTYCTTMHQETEADVVSARLLAHSGFDPRRAVHFWERRGDDAECVAGAGSHSPEEREKLRAQREGGGGFAMGLFGSAHPISEVRVQRLREELERWESERQRALDHHRNSAQS